jgi:signal transduction histidine kinase
MIRECPVLTEYLVHTMLDRARRFSAANWEDEKETSLGRLAAGLSHDLNNPAAAAARGARILARTVTDVGEAAQSVGAAPLTEVQRNAIGELVTRCQQARRMVSLGAMERADRIEEFAAALETHGLDADIAETLVDGGVAVAEIELLLATLPSETRPAVTRWVAAAALASNIAGDIESATRRIDSLVTAVRRYTHMDRAPARELIDVGRGLADTIEVFRAEANGRGVSVTLDVADDLPKVAAVAPDLNQAWANLLHNALDAMPDGGGIVSARASFEDKAVVVRVTDTGSGIAGDIQPQIFDPFFTTKPQGTGVGLGLDIVRRIVRAHDGSIEFSSRPGHTEFCVRLPVLTVL